MTVLVGKDQIPDMGFGVSTTAEDVVDALGFFDDWEERYKYIIDLGKELPAMAPEHQIEDNLVRGCQSQVWMICHRDNESRYWFAVDSDAFIVKGLLAVVMCAYNGKTAADILAMDVEQYFTALDLIKHLSPSRGNGLRAMVKKIQDLASA